MRTLTGGEASRIRQPARDARAALLISPPPLDGYPPVQHQARLLAADGFAVEVITTPFAWSAGVSEFSAPGVAVRHVSAGGSGAAGRVNRVASFIAAVTAARVRLGRSLAVEIAYDPIGVLYSDLAPLRPSLRIAHFHECLQDFDTAWLESRIARSIRNYQIVVVADQERARLMKHQLKLETEPLAVPNYPIAIDRAWPLREVAERCEVVYCGSLGLQQKLDVIIQSVQAWPANASLTLIGNDGSDTARKLKAQAAALSLQSRVSFEGWIAYADLPARLARADVGIVFLDPSFEQWRTAFGASNKRYQYMQAGLPQIGDMNPGIAEMLEGQGIGRCVTTHEPEELAEVVADYAGDRARRLSEGARALELHLEMYNYQMAFEPVLSRILARVGNAAPRAPRHRAA